jgi:hypothetical protein
MIGYIKKFKDRLNRYSFPVTIDKAVYMDGTNTTLFSKLAEIATSLTTLGNYKLAVGNDYRPNLLINANFPVNQRGQSSTTITNDIGTFVVDRWIAFGNASCNYVVTKTTDGLKLGAMTLGTFRGLYYTIERNAEVDRDIAGKTVTLSVSVDGVIYSNTFIYAKQYTTLVANNLYDIVCNATHVASYGYIQIVFNKDNVEHTINWIKLELNDHATPFIPKSYAEEFRDCRRYYKRIKAGTTYYYFGGGGCYGDAHTVLIFIPPTEPMRTQPTLAGYNYLAITNFISSTISIVSVSITQNSTEGCVLMVTIDPAVNLTPGQLCYLMAYNNTDAYIAFDAEF